MAQTVYCQEQGCGEVAAYILSDLADGGTQTFCMAHYIGLVLATAQAVQAQQAAQEPPEEPAAADEQTASVHAGGDPDTELDASAAVDAEASETAHVGA